jgi:hypothetical protein
MATPEVREAKIKEAKDLLSMLAEIKPSTLARSDELSRDINFSEAVPSFVEMIDIVKQLNQRDITRLGLTQLTGIVTGSTKLKTLIKQVTDFDMNQNTPGDVCKSIIQTIVSSYDEVIEPLTIPLAFTATQSTDYAKIEREVKGYHSTMRKEADDFRITLESYKSEAENALSAVKEQAAEAGVSTNAQIFLSDSEGRSKVPIKWLIAIIVMAILTLIVAVIGVYTSFVYELGPVSKVIQYVINLIIETILWNILTF